MIIDLNEQTKHVVDFVSLTAVLATLAAWLPPLAALASLIWTGIRIFETDTVQRWLRIHKFKSQQLKGED